VVGVIMLLTAHWVMAADKYAGQTGDGVLLEGRQGACDIRYVAVFCLMVLGRGNYDCYIGGEMAGCRELC